MTRRLTRDKRRAMIAGVAAGLARYLEVDTTLVRLAFVLMTLVPSHGLGVLIYVVCWIVMPRDDVSEADADQAPASAPDLSGLAPSEGLHRGRAAFGVGLMGLGLLLLFQNLGWLHWLTWACLSTFWPVILIAVGASLAYGSRWRTAR
jgi:phage shock protein C